jgi:hypothetical protein
MVDNSGYLYCFGNIYLPDIYKVGATYKDIKERLYSANINDPFKINGYVITYVKKVNFLFKNETKLKKILSDKGERIISNKEFFRMDFEKILESFEEIDGEIIDTSLYLENKKKIIAEQIAFKMVKSLLKKEKEKYKEKEFKCEKCNIIFKHKFILENHYKSVLHKTGKRKTRIDKNPDLKCNKCDYNTRYPDQLKMHILNKHSTKEERENNFDFYCKLCDTGFRYENIYNKHLKTSKHKYKLHNLY